MEKRNLTKIIITMVLCAAMLGMVACGSSNKLAGEWQVQDSQNVSSSFPEYMCLFSNGTGTGDGYGLDWVTENGKLKLNVKNGFSNECFVYDYKVSGKKLTLTLNGNKTAVYTKK